MTTETKPRIAPNSKESEMMVLGSMLTSINALNVSADALDDSDFYYTEHKIIFSVLKGSRQNDKPADVHLVCEELKRQGKLSTVGGAAYVTTLAQYAGTSAYIEEYVQIVKDKSLLRELILVNQKSQNKALENQESVDDILDEVDERIQSIKSSKEKCSFNFLKENNSESEITDELKNLSPSISTGFTIGEADLKIPSGAISIIAAQTSHGKTATLINLGLGAIKYHSDISVYFFSYEESGASILCKFMNSWIGKEFSKNNRESIKSHFIKGNIEYINTNMRSDFLRDKKAFFDHVIDNGKLKVFYSDFYVEELVSAIHFLKRETNVGLICIDYMQLIRMRAYNQGSRQEELKRICLLLKNCAVETGLPILIAAQFNREVMSESDLSPTKIGEAGDIERIASLILGMWNRNFKGFSKEARSKGNNDNQTKEPTIYFEVLKGRDIGNGYNTVMDFDGNTGTLKNKTNTQNCASSSTATKYQHASRGFNGKKTK